MTKEELEELGWDDMAWLNPEKKYSHPTFGFNVRIIERNYTAQYFLRLKDGIEIWSVDVSMFPPSCSTMPYFKGEMNKAELKTWMEKNL